MNDEQKQGVAAVGFLVLAFTDEDAADGALKELKAAKKQKQFYFEDAAVVKQDAKGKVHFHETGDIRTGKGAGVGAIVGGVLGILGGPAGIALGAGVGAAAGAVASARDTGFKDDSLKSVGVALKPNTSALAMITSHQFLKELHKQSSDEEIAEMVGNLAEEISGNLDQGKSMALGIILAEDGLAVREVAVSEESAEIAGYVVTDEAVVAGAARVTADEVDYEIGVATEEGAVVEAGVITEEGAVVADMVALPEESEDEAAEEVEEEAEEEAEDESESG
jgi:uncharacterized membrane protein